MSWLNGEKLPVLPDSLLPLVIGGKKGQKVSKDMEIISCSNQYWQSLSANEQTNLLDLIEWIGGNRDEYIRKMRAVLPRNPKGK